MHETLFASQSQLCVQQRHQEHVWRRAKAVVLCRKTAFASRSQLCVHSSIKNMSGVAQKSACEAAIKSKGCTYWNPGKARSDALGHLENIADIEDLVHVGMSKHVRSSTGRWLPCDSIADIED